MEAGFWTWPVEPWSAWWERSLDRVWIGIGCWLGHGEGWFIRPSGHGWPHPSMSWEYWPDAFYSGSGPPSWKRSETKVDLAKAKQLGLFGVERPWLQAVARHGGPALVWEAPVFGPGSGKRLWWMSRPVVSGWRWVACRLLLGVCLGLASSLPAGALSGKVSKIFLSPLESCTECSSAQASAVGSRYLLARNIFCPLWDDQRVWNWIAEGTFSLKNFSNSCFGRPWISIFLACSHHISASGHRHNFSQLSIRTPDCSETSGAQGVPLWVFCQKRDYKTIWIVGPSGAGGNCRWCSIGIWGTILIVVVYSYLNLNCISWYWYQGHRHRPGRQNIGSLWVRCSGHWWFWVVVGLWDLRGGMVRGLIYRMTTTLFKII